MAPSRMSLQQRLLPRTHTRPVTIFEELDCQRSHTVVLTTLPCRVKHTGGNQRALIGVQLLLLPVDDALALMRTEAADTLNLDDLDFKSTRARAFEGMSY
jgi:hypothetical protein